MKESNEIRKYTLKHSKTKPILTKSMVNLKRNVITPCSTNMEHMARVLTRENTPYIHYHMKATIKPKNFRKFLDEQQEKLSINYK